jgi:hypothetical protein
LRGLSLPEQEGMEFNYAQIEKLIDFGIDGVITETGYFAGHSRYQGLESA